MDTTGRLVSVARDIVSKKLMVSFVIDTEPVDDLNALAQLEKIDIKAGKHKKRRSLDANGMLWACLSEMASVLRADKWDVYLMMLKRYGKFTYICVKPAVVDAVKAQWRECEVIGEVDINGQKAVQMLCYFGSSTYDTAEFSRLLDGVVSEMKEMGLTPPPSEEMGRAIELWEKQRNKAY
ncbi:MAG: hypothetical protein IKB07_08350 [Lachnospiraceae bacterium]|nr:hypothetical protein [Lachnospiraceae bacterium]